MEINGLKLPASFVQDIQERKFQREFGVWELKQDFDAYGNKLETEIGDVYDNSESLVRETNSISKYFPPDAICDEHNEWENEPGFIPDINDFSQVVEFAVGGDGSPFCFDYRDDTNNPSIIWWADAYWRRIAPNYKTFIELFDFSKAE
jgi:hypothetical protein